MTNIQEEELVASDLFTECVFMPILKPFIYSLQEEQMKKALKGVSEKYFQFVMNGPYTQVG